MAPSRHRAVRGFTLIELMIVVAIVGILATLAIANFTRFSCRARTTEAKIGLRQIFSAEEAYRGEHDRYFAGDETALRAIGFNMQTVTKYDYSVVVTDDFSFNAVADGKSTSDMAGDQWIIDESARLIWAVTTPNCE